MENEEDYINEDVFDDFLKYINVPMIYSFGKEMTREWALYKIYWDLIYGQCFDSGIFQEDEAKKFIEKIDQIISSDAFFYQLEISHILTSNATFLSGVVWLSLETVGMIFFIGTD